MAAQHPRTALEQPGYRPSPTIALPESYLYPSTNEKNAGVWSHFGQSGALLASLLSVVVSARVATQPDSWVQGAASIMSAAMLVVFAGLLLPPFFFFFSAGFEVRLRQHVLLGYC